MRRRLMLKSSAGVSPVLPAEYQQVEYIENIGGSYIVTQFILPQNCTVNATIRPPATGGETAAVNCLAPGSLNLLGFDYGATPNSKRAFSYLGVSLATTYTNDSPLLSLTTYLTPSSQTGFFTVDGVAQAQQTVTVTRDYYSNPIVLFRSAHLTSRNPLIFTGQIHSFKVESNNVTVCDLIPCYRKADNEIGMYDTVSQTFYTNAGTGTFVKGADI